MAPAIDPEVKKLLDLRLARGEISSEEYSSLIDTLLNPGERRRAAPQARESHGSQSTGRDESNLVIDDGLVIRNSGVSYQGNDFSFDLVTGLAYLAEANSVRVGLAVIPAFYRTTLTIVLNENIDIAKSAESRFSRKRQHAVLDQAYAHLSNVTYTARLGRITDALKTRGSIELPTDPPVQLHASGDVDLRGLRENLATAFMQQRIEFGGSKYLYSVRDPDIIRIRMEGSSLIAKKIEFTLRMNRDVIIGLFGHLMKYGSL